MAKKRPSRPSSMPRAITPGLVAAPEKPITYRSPMHLERQKFINRDKIAQLYFKETNQTPDLETLKDFGLDMEVGEARALAAVQILLDDTGFRGHENTGLRVSDNYKGNYSLPILRITPTQYYEAYGLEKYDAGGKKRYPGRQMEEALQDLLSLNKPRRIIYERKRWVGRADKRKELSDIVIAPEGKLVDVNLVYQDVESEEADRIKAGDAKASRLTGIVITCGIPLIDQVDRYYVLKRRDLFKEIQSLYPGRKQPRGVSQLVEYFWTLDFTPLEMRPENLARVAGLGYLIDQRHKKDALKRLQEYIDAIHTLGYIVEWTINPTGNYVLSLNPEKCHRLPSPVKLPGEGEGQDDS